MDYKQTANGSLRELALFAGAGGGILGGKLLGWRTVCAVEIDEYCRAVLCQRQNDGCLEAFPVWDDVRSFDGRPWRGLVDVVSGGFPCQDISCAGKGVGIEGARSGLWSEMARIVCEVRPQYAFIENSPMLANRGLTRVLGDLVEMGFNAQWGIVSAADVGAPHLRKRLWIVANAMRNGATKESRSVEPEAGRAEISARRRKWGKSGNGSAEVSDADQCGCDAGWGCSGASMADTDKERNQRLRERKTSQFSSACSSRQHVADADSKRQPQPKRHEPEQRRRVIDSRKNVPDCNGQGLEVREGVIEDAGQKQPSVVGIDWWELEPDVGRVANGVAARVDRLKAVGNGQVPSVAKLAWEILSAKETR